MLLIPYSLENYSVYNDCLLKLNGPIAMEQIPVLAQLQERFEGATQEVEVSESECIFLLECFHHVGWHCSAARRVFAAYKVLENLLTNQGGEST